MNLTKMLQEVEPYNIGFVLLIGKLPNSEYLHIVQEYLYTDGKKTKGLLQLEQAELIRYLKNGEPRLTKKGKALIKSLYDVEVTEDAHKIYNNAVTLYKEYGVENRIDSLKSFSLSNIQKTLDAEVLDKNGSPYTVKHYTYAIKHYLENTEKEYVAKLSNLFFKRVNAYDTVFSLEKSRLYNYILENLK